MILHISMSPCRHPSRIYKEANSVIQADIVSSVLIVALFKNGLPLREEVVNKINILRVPLVSQLWPKNFFFQIIKYLEWVIRMAWVLRKEDVEVIHSHSLGALGAGVFLKLIRRRPLIYDAHELETERNGEVGFRQKISKIVESFFLRFTDKVIVVTDSIADWYRDNYKIDRPTVVRNVPNRNNTGVPQSVIFREKFGINKSDVIYIYQGKMSQGRNVELLLRVFSQVQNSHIVFMGHGPLENRVIAAEHEFSNIHFQPAVPQNKILEYTASADIGLAVPENNCLSHYYALGNKHFEYLLSGLPLLVSDFPERGRLVDENNCGWKVSPDENSLIHFINNITWEDILEKKKNAIASRNLYSWEQEEVDLLKLYKKIL